MQQIQYYKSAWGDVKNSPGWFGKLCLLALVNFIPVFGQIVTLGYLYGWAREIAWETHEPMPTRIFGNDDGKLYRRGWFVLVLTFVASLVPSIVMNIGSTMQGAGLWGVAARSHAVANSLVSGLGLLVYLVGFVGLLLLMVLAWIGSMRISIYDRLSAGFQLGKIWKMFRYDTNGAMRIFGMYLLVGLIIGIVLSVVYFIVIFFIVFAGVAGLAASGYNVSALQHMTDAQVASMMLQFIASAGVVGFFGILALAFVTSLGEMFVMLLVARAMGYWTMQFNVPRWRGQDEPMPFELEPAASAPMPQNPVPPASQQPPYGAYGQQAQPYGTQQQPQQSQQPQQPQQLQPDPMAPIVPVVAEESSAAFGEPATAADELAKAAPDGPAAGAAEDDQTAQANPAAPGEAAVVAPGQLSGFTYTGVAGSQAPITPSGADPSAETVSDLLVVIPEESEGEGSTQD